MRIRKIGCLFVLLLLCLALAGCRTRTGGSDAAPPDTEMEGAASAQPLEPGSLPDAESNASEFTEEQEKNEVPGEQTQENPEASRKEYDENAPAEIVAGTDRTVHAEGEGDGAFAQGDPDSKTVSKLNAAAAETATQTVPAEEAEQLGVSEDADEADSAMTYYTVLLADRMGSLFECQRQYVYWETAADHVTVFKTSPEHSLILNAGAYDVSARLLEKNLLVDDGWICRKNPGVVVKVVDGSVLGKGVSSTGKASGVYAALLSRDGWPSMDAVRNRRVILLSEELLEAPYLQVAAMLTIAKTANPELLAEVDLDKAIEMLSEEATGSMPIGIYYFNGQGGS